MDHFFNNFDFSDCGKLVRRIRQLPIFVENTSAAGRNAQTPSPI